MDMDDDYEIEGVVALRDRGRIAWARFGIDRKEMHSAQLVDLVERYMKPAFAAARQELQQRAEDVVKIS